MKTDSRGFSMKMFSILFILICVFWFVNFPPLLAKSTGITEFDNYKIITINNTQVTIDMVNFPLFISIVDSDLFNCQYDGDDITFWNSENTIQYNHEVERFNKSTGELSAWVQIPFLSSSVDTSFRVYYGNPSAVNSEHEETVWNEYAAVYHLSILNDSAKSNDLTKVGSVLENISGKFASAQEFDGYGNDFLFTNTNFQINTSFTVSCWIKIEDTDVDQTFTTLPHSLTGVAQRLMLNWDNNSVLARNYNLSALGVNTVSESVINDGSWHYLVHTYDNNTNKLFIDGVLEGSSSHSGIVRCEYGKFFIGREGDYTHSSWQETVVDGLIDEVRVSSVPLTAEQIAIEWNNYNNPSTFYHFSEEYLVHKTTSTTEISTDTTTDSSTTTTIQNTTVTNTKFTTTSSTRISSTTKTSTFNFLIVFPVILFLRRKHNSNK
ncbi:hypothetical protein CEE45_13200 [Candidatus Heimdallarchaeota archaeon B3_Heim]|nr:MAG: hypothetical protein CEE45_13200 [Candidatus Heimdallarchaeota archaeon B3_Heim]